MLDRRPAAHKVILRALPLAISQRFDPSTAGDLEAVFELRVRDPAGRTAARFELAIASGALGIWRRMRRRAWRVAVSTTTD